MSSEKEAQITKLEALANDKEQIRKMALRVAGIYLQASRDEIVQQEIGTLDEEIIEDNELYQAHEALIEEIADEVQRIGKELSDQAKQLKHT